eukprot:5127248-Prymnesium_polylepis.1
MHSSLAKDAAMDAAETADGVGKSLTSAAVVRDHGGSGAGALVGITCIPIPIRSARAADVITHRSKPIRDGRHA